MHNQLTPAAVLKVRMFKEGEIDGGLPSLLKWTWAITILRCSEDDARCLTTALRNNYCMF